MVTDKLTGACEPSMQRDGYHAGLRCFDMEARGLPLREPVLKAPSLET